MFYLIDGAFAYTFFKQLNFRPTGPQIIENHGIFLVSNSTKLNELEPKIVRLLSNIEPRLKNTF